MRLVLFIAISMVVATFGYSQELTINAKNIKEFFPTEYQNTIRANAIKKWNTDHNMVVYEINLQCDELMSLLSIYKREHFNTLYNAIITWSTKGYEPANKMVWQSFSSFTLANAMKLNVDWQMVKYEYDMQVKASSAY